MVRKISCRRCGACAKTANGLKISQAERKAIGKKLPVVIRGGLEPTVIIPVGENRLCVAFAAGGKKPQCKIYASRPAICRQYSLLFFNGRAIIQRDCTAVKELLAEGATSLTRKEIKGIPFLRKSLEALEQAFPEVKKQKEFEITAA